MRTLLAAISIALAGLPTTGFAQSNEASINGWQSATWGMSRAEVQRLFSTAKPEDMGGCGEDIWRDSPGVCPLLVIANYDISGTPWDITLLFKSDRLVQVELKAKSAVSPEGLYENVKQALQAKYGVGKERSFNHNGRCDTALARWNSGAKVPHYHWYARDEGQEYAISDRLGVVTAFLTEAPICLNVPRQINEVPGGARRVSILYLKRDQVDPSKL